MEQKNQITQWLNQISKGSDEAYDKLFSMVYDQLQVMAHRQISQERADHTYSKTDLVHELYIKLFVQEQLDFKDRANFFSIAARSMRQILIDHARKKMRKKRGGDRQIVTFLDNIIMAEHQAAELLQINEALNRLSEFDQRLSTIVELHYFGEMSFVDIAELMDLSARTVYRDWAKARGWLFNELRK